MACCSALCSTRVESCAAVGAHTEPVRGSKFADSAVRANTAAYHGSDQTRSAINTLWLRVLRLVLANRAIDTRRSIGSWLYLPRDTKAALHIDQHLRVH